MALALAAHAQGVRITLPKRSKPTPVQNFNREGVNAIKNHDYTKAKRLFYRAYLLDPNDPFTLNNLGYISELEGDSDRAARYYDLAQQQNSDALVDVSSSPDLKGKPVDKVAGDAEDTKLQVNRMNLQAIQLLMQDRAPEADILLEKALRIDNNNPFTMNNLGYAKEKEGEIETALSDYTAAANRHSDEPIIVSVNKDWRGKPISEIAEKNADKLRKLMTKEETPEAKVRRLNLEGVSALNRNDHRAARSFFEQAYKLDPNSSFTLNNMGYLAEMDGDKETADFYYDRAREAERNSARVDVATRHDAEGRPIGSVADTSQEKVDARMQAELAAKRAQGGPVVLKRRDGSAVVNEDRSHRGPIELVPRPSQNDDQQQTSPDQTQTPPTQTIPPASQDQATPPPQ
jgi:Flp pilus assembly protein TadD